MQFKLYVLRNSIALLFFIATILTTPIKANFSWEKSSYSTHELIDIDASISKLDELLNLLKQILEKEKILKDYQIVVFVDFDDTIAQRTFMIKSVTGVVYPFRYLSSLETERGIANYIESYVKDLAPDDLEKQELLRAAKQYVLSRFVSEQAIYHCPEAQKLLLMFAQLKKMGIAIKICSSRPLNQSMEDTIKFLGLKQEDYIVAQNKGAQLARYIIEDANNNSNPSKTYIAVYVDNYIAKNYNVDPFTTKALEQSSSYHILSDNYRDKLLPNRRIINITVQDNRLTSEVVTQKSAVKKEIGFATRLYKESGFLSAYHAKEKQQLQQKFTQDLAALDKAQEAVQIKLEELYDNFKIFE